MSKTKELDEAALWGPSESGFGSRSPVRERLSFQRDKWRKRRCFSNHTLSDATFVRVMPTT